MAVQTIFAIVVGVIVFFMVLAGVVGWVKTRRNAERYGPRAGAPGRPRQTRTKGLALAVLDSIPIVKFGSKSNKDSEVGPNSKDIELGDRESTVNGESERTPDSDQNGDFDETGGAELTGKDRWSRTAFKTPFHEYQCAICISDFVADEEVRVLPCNHRYHPECIDPWLLNISGTCPVCRYDLRPNDPNNTEEESLAEESQLPVTSPIGYIRAEALRQEAARLDAFANPVAITNPAPVQASPRGRISIRSRLREIRQASHSGPEYVTALGNFYRDRENRRPSMEA